MKSILFFRIWAPFITGFDTDTGRATGFYSDIMALMMSSLNFSLDVNFMQKDDPDMMNWTEMIDAIGRNEFDMGLTGFSQVDGRFQKARLLTKKACLPSTSSNSFQVDFSTAFTSSAIRLFFLRHSPESSMLVYLGSFRTRAWKAIGASIITFTVIVCAVAVVPVTGRTGEQKQFLLYPKKRRFNKKALP
jgi:hypothetical protein